MTIYIYRYLFIYICRKINSRSEVLKDTGASLQQWWHLNLFSVRRWHQSRRRMQKQTLLQLQRFLTWKTSMNGSGEICMFYRACGCALNQSTDGAPGAPPLRASPRKPCTDSKFNNFAWHGDFNLDPWISYCLMRFIFPSTLCASVSGTHDLRTTCGLIVSTRWNPSYWVYACQLSCRPT